MKSKVKVILFLSLMILLVLTISGAYAFENTGDTGSYHDSTSQDKVYSQDIVGNDDITVSGEEGYNNKVIKENSEKIGNFKRDGSDTNTPHLTLDEIGNTTTMNAVAFTGRVYDADDNPLSADVTIDLKGDFYNNTLTLTSTSDGCYEYYTSLPQGNYNLKVSLTDYDVEAVESNFVVEIADFEHMNYNPYNNNYLKDSYNIGFLYLDSGEYVDSVSLNLTVNGETHTIIAYSSVVVNNSVFSGDNPLFTTPGVNNISFVVNGERYSSFAISTTFNTTDDAVFIFKPITKGHLNNSYLIGSLLYGNDYDYQYLSDIPINLTVNGETHEIQTDSNAMIYVNNAVFSQDNDLFTRLGENSITLSIENSEYGVFTNTTTFTTVTPIELDQTNSSYENVKYVPIHYRLNAYRENRIITVVINNQIVETRNYYYYNDECLTEEFTYKFVPESTGNYIVYVEVTGYSGDYNSSVMEFEVLSTNDEKLNLNVTLDYNSTIYYPDIMVINGLVLDEYGTAYTGVFYANGEQYSTGSDGSFSYYNYADIGDNIIDFVFGGDEYETTTIQVDVTCVEKVLNNTDINIVVDDIDDVEVSQFMILSCRVLDFEDNPVSNVLVEVNINGSYTNGYTDVHGKSIVSMYVPYNLGLNTATFTVKTANGNVSVNKTFNVVKATPTIELLGESVRDDVHSLEISGYVHNFTPKDETPLFVTVNGQQYNTSCKYSWSIKIPVNQTGVYDVEVVLPEGEYNLPASNSTAITVNSINNTKIGAKITLNDVSDVTVTDAVFFNIHVCDDELNDLRYIPIEVMVIGDYYNETVTLESDYSGECYTYFYLPEGNYHVKVTFNELDYEDVVAEDDFKVISPLLENIFPELTTNDTYLRDGYTLLEVICNYDGYTHNLPQIQVNLTVNGEKQTVIPMNGYIHVNTTVFDSDNPIFTTIGDNNITFSILSADYEEEFVFTTSAIASLQYNPVYASYLNDSYDIGVIEYGYNDYSSLHNVDINLTVNGETRTVTTYYGHINVNKTVFNENNPIFTTLGENNIIIAFEDERFGSYTNDTTFMTVTPIELAQMNPIYENVKFVNIEYTLNAYMGNRVINVYINDEIVDTIEYYYYNPSHESRNFTYQFVPSTPGNYKVYVEVTGDSGDYNTSITEFEVVSLHEGLFKLNVTFDYNNTVYYPDNPIIRGTVVDENGDPYVGRYISPDYYDFMEYSYTNADGTFTYYGYTSMGSKSFTFTFGDDEYYELTTVTTEVNTIERILDNADVKLVLNANNTTYSDSVTIVGQLLDLEDNPLSNIKVIVSQDDTSYSLKNCYTDVDGEFNAYFWFDEYYSVDGVATFYFQVETKNGTYMMSIDVNMTKATPRLTIVEDSPFENIHYLHIEGSVEDYATSSDELIVKVNNQTYNTRFYSYSQWHIDVPVNTTGEYYVEVTLPEDDKHYSSTVNTTIMVNSINTTDINVELTLNEVNDIYIGDNIAVEGTLYDEESNPLEDVPLKINIANQYINKTINTSTNYYGEYYYYDSELPQGEYKIQVTFEKSGYETAVKEDKFKVSIYDVYGLDFYIDNNGTILNNSYSIGYLDDGSWEIHSYTLNVTVNGESQTVIADKRVNINDTVFGPENPIFTTIGDNNITIKFIGEEYSDYQIDTIFATNESTVFYIDYGNMAYLSDSYITGAIYYGTIITYNALKDVTLDVTVNGETHTINTDQYGQIIINNTVFSPENPLFTTVGDNNITLTLNDEVYQEYTNETTFTTTQAELFYYMYDGRYLNNCYGILSLYYGNTEHYENLAGKDVEVTVNGETQMATIDDMSRVVVDDMTFSADNPIFTTAGKYNITVKFSDENYGNITINTTFTTIDIELIPQKVSRLDEDTIIVSGYLQNTVDTPLYDNEVIVTIDGREYVTITNLEDGYYQVNCDVYDYKTYTIVVTSYYENLEAKIIQTYTHTLYATIDLDITPVSIGNPVNLTATINTDSTVNDGKVYFKINGRILRDNATGKVIYAYVEDNVAKLENFNLTQSWNDKTEIIATYIGSDEIGKISSPTVNPTIDEQETESIFEVGDMTASQGETITINITTKNMDKGKVVLKVNGKTVKASDGKLYAKVAGDITQYTYTLPQTIKKGEYTIKAVYTCDSTKLETESTLTII